MLHAAGANVVVAARRYERLLALAERLGPRVLAIPCDVSSPCLGSFGAIDIVVNNAGIGTPTKGEVEDPDHWRRVLDVNLTGTFLLSQAAGRVMLEAGGGSIINIASILGIVASAPIAQASYCASKGGVVSLTRELGCQWARRGVRVNAIAPGWFPTEMTGDMFDDEASMEFVRRNTPVGGQATRTRSTAQSCSSRPTHRLTSLATS